MRWLAGLVALFALAVACDVGDGPSGGAAGPAREITIAIGGEPTTLDPQLRDDGLERAVNDNIYETLLARRPDGTLVPGLASSMPTQVDERTWRFSLREGVSFHNGEAFDADAVVHSVERIVDPDFGSEQYGSFFGTIVGAEKVDAYTVDILTSGPDPVLPSRMYWLKIVPPEASQEPTFAEQPVGTGPYRFVEWVRGERITLEASPDHWEGAPPIERVTFRFAEDPSTRVSGLLAGEFDLITNLLPEDADTVPKAAAVRGLEHPTVILNAMGGITADLRVRQALNLAVDKEALAEELFAGNATVDDCQLLSPSWFGYNPDLEPYPYDPDRARQLLEEAGVVGEQIELIGEEGRWLKDRETIEAVAGYWREVGLDVRVRIFDFNEYLNRLFDRETRPDSVFVVSSNELLDADRTLSGEYHMDGIEASNDDARLAALIDEARSETDPERRQELYAEATRIACEQAYFLFLLNINDTYGMSERLVWEPRVDAKLLVKEMRLAG
ncbi:MAG TPA: ABC transporter substrate-binding protein [Actinomycetota bacterium]|nr:ABC transporter substrate-binding protein [Actinomycetota bacterium]